MDQRRGLGCRSKRQRGKVHVLGGSIGEAQVWTPTVVEREVFSNADGGRRHRVVRVEIHWPGWTSNRLASSVRHEYKRAFVTGPAKADAQRISRAV